MGYAIKLQPQAAQIYNGDKVDVALTGSNTGTFTFTVVYVAKDEVCLLSDSNMGNANWSTACAKSWGWSCKIGGKSYSSSDAGQSVAKIPTLEQVAGKCACWGDIVALLPNTGFYKFFWAPYEPTSYRQSYGYSSNGWPAITYSN